MSHGMYGIHVVMYCCFMLVRDPVAPINWVTHFIQVASTHIDTHSYTRAVELALTNTFACT